MCAHEVRCPDADAPDAGSAWPVAWNPEEGWELLCNGLLVGNDMVATDAPFDGWRWIPPVSPRPGAELRPDA
jgi:hypothetical protein